MRHGCGPRPISRNPPPVGLRRGRLLPASRNAGRGRGRAADGGLGDADVANGVPRAEGRRVHSPAASSFFATRSRQRFWHRRLASKSGCSIGGRARGPPLRWRFAHWPDGRQACAHRPGTSPHKTSVSIILDMPDPAWIRRKNGMPVMNWGNGGRRPPVGHYGLLQFIIVAVVGSHNPWAPESGSSRGTVLVGLMQICACGRHSSGGANQTGAGGDMKLIMASSNPFKLECGGRPLTRWACQGLTVSRGEGLRAPEGPDRDFIAGPNTVTFCPR